MNLGLAKKCAKTSPISFYVQREEENRVFGIKSNYLQQTIVCHVKFVMWYVEPFNVETVYYVCKTVSGQ